MPKSALKDRNMQGQEMMDTPKWYKLVAAFDCVQAKFAHTQKVCMQTYGQTHHHPSSSNSVTE